MLYKKELSREKASFIQLQFNELQVYGEDFAEYAKTNLVQAKRTVYMSRLKKLRLIFIVRAKNRRFCENQESGA